MKHGLHHSGDVPVQVQTRPLVVAQPSSTPLPAPPSSVNVALWVWITVGIVVICAFVSVIVLKGRKT